MTYILFIIFFNPQTQSMTAEFDSRSACMEAKRELEDARINAKLFCLAKKIEGFGE